MTEIAGRSFVKSFFLDTGVAVVYSNLCCMTRCIVAAICDSVHDFILMIMEEKRLKKTFLALAMDIFSIGNDWNHGF